MISASALRYRARQRSTLPSWSAAISSSMNCWALTHATAAAPPLRLMISLPIAFARCVFPTPLGPWMNSGL